MYFVMQCKLFQPNKVGPGEGTTTTQEIPLHSRPPPPKKPEGTPSRAPFALLLGVGKRRRPCCPPSSGPASTRPTARGACGRALKRRVLSLRFRSLTGDLGGKHECGLDWLWLCCIGCLWWSSWLCKSRQCPFLSCWSPLWWVSRIGCLSAVNGSKEYLAFSDCIGNPDCPDGNEIL